MGIFVTQDGDIFFEKGSEKMSAKKSTAKCPTCGKRIDPQAASCPYCSGEEQAQVHKRNIPMAILKVLFSCIFSAMLIAFTTVFSLLLFVRGITDEISFPSIGPVNGKGLTQLAGSWLPVAFIAVFVCISLLLITVTNVRRIRYVFIYTGASLFIVSLACLTIGIAEQYLIKYFVKELQSVLTYASDKLLGFEIICAVLTFALSMVCFVIYILIWAATRSSDRKNLPCCPYCGAPVRPELTYCENCRNPLPAAPIQTAAR